MIDTVDLLILKTIAVYYTLQRVDLQALCLPRSDKASRTARRHLNKLLHLGFINQTNGEVIFQNKNGAPAPVYFPSKKGLELLYCETKDERYLSVCSYTPNWQHLYHWLAVARFHVLLCQAAALNPEVSVEHWLGEWDVADHHAKEPQDRYRLFTLAAELPRRLVFNPDASFVLGFKGQRRGYYLEMDRSTSSISQTAHSKTPSVPVMLERCLHSRHFPGAEDVPFRVLMVTQNEGRRDAMAKAIAGKAGAELWRFLSLTKKAVKEDGQVDIIAVTAEALLFDWGLLGCDDRVRSIIKSEEAGQ